MNLTSHLTLGDSPDLKPEVQPSGSRTSAWLGPIGYVTFERLLTIQSGNPDSLRAAARAFEEAAALLEAEQAGALRAEALGAIA